MEGEKSPSMAQSSMRTPVLACDLCRQRKTRCDEGDPCHQCTAAKAECKRTYIPRTREKRQRVLVTHQYEQKIDRIEEQIQTLSSILNEIRDRSDPTTNNASPVVAATATPAQVQPEEPSYEGESSFTAHYRFANDFAESALKNSASPHDPKTLTALRELSSTITPQRTPQDATYDYAVSTSTPATKYELPPFADVAALLKGERESSNDSYGQWLISIVNTDILTQHCIDVYFTPTHTDTQLITATGNLFWLFADKAAAVSDSSLQDAHLRNANLCRVAVETALSRLPLYMSLTMDSVYALVTGAIHAVGVAKPSLAWTLTCKASEVCQSLGLHRASPLRDQYVRSNLDTVDPFWIVYVLDKGLSLRLGRASTIQDYDTDLPRQFLDPRSSKVTAYQAKYLQLWIAVAQVQGEVYKDLYSPHAMTFPHEAREVTARKCVAELTGIRAELNQILELMLKNSASDARYAVLLKGDEVAIACTITLIYRALPPDAGSPLMFNAKCMAAARETLECHQESMRMLEPGDIYMLEMYINWSLLHAPFIPFIVIFCNIIETGDLTDVAQLQSFLETLDIARSMSQPMDKAYRLFETLLDLARQSVARRTDGAAEQTKNAPSNYGDHLNFDNLQTGEDALRYGRPAQQYPQSMLQGDLLHVGDNWSAEQQQMFDVLQDEAMQLFGVNFLGDFGNVS